MKSFIIAIATAMPLYAQDAPTAESQKPEQDTKCTCQPCPGGNRHGHHHGKASPFAREAQKLVLANYDKDGDGQLNDNEKVALQADAKVMMEQKKAEFQAKREQRRAEWAKNNPEKTAKREQKKAKFLIRHDKDGDGKLSDDEKAAIKAEFQVKREQRGPKCPEGPHHKSMFAQMMIGHALMLEKYDANKDGKLSREELGDLAPKGERCGKGRHGHRGHGPQQAPELAPAPQQ